MKPKTIMWTVGIIAVIGSLLFWNLLFPAKPASTISDPSALPGLQTVTAPWPAELQNLSARLRAIGLPALSAEGSALHIHQHLDLMINGAPVAIPSGIGINAAAGFISDIHVHDDTGVIHVESPTRQTFTLGQFFDIWGVRLTASCIGGYCTDATHSITVYSNGKPVSGNPRSLALESHQEIVIVYGSNAAATGTIPSTYTFPAGE